MPQVRLHVRSNSYNQDKFFTIKKLIYIPLFNINENGRKEKSKVCKERGIKVQEIKSR